VTLGQIDMFGAIDLQEEINKGNIAEANTVLEGIKEQSKATVDVAKEERGAAVDVAETEERIVEAELASEEKRLTEQLDTDEALARIDAKNRTDIQRMITDGEYEKAQLLMDGEKALQTEALTVEQENLIKQLANDITMGRIDADAAKSIQRTITRGDIDIAQKELDAVTATLSSEEKRLTEQLDTDEALMRIDAKSRTDIQRMITDGEYEKAQLLMDGEKALQSEALTFEQENLIKQLANDITMGRIDADAAKTIQRSITRGDIEVAKEQRGEAVDVAKEARGSAKDIAEIDEAMQTERLTYEQANLLESLKTEVTLGRIDAGTRKSIQNMVIKGDLAEARQQLDYAREIAAGQVTIGDEQVPTIEAGRFNLEEALTNAQLEQLVKTEQGQSIANLISLVQTLDPGSVAREELEAKIALEVQASIGDQALRNVLLDMLRPIDLGGEEETGGL